jgi:hypothetical protein
LRATNDLPGRKQNHDALKLIQLISGWSKISGEEEGLRRRWQIELGQIAVAWISQDNYRLFGWSIFSRGHPMFFMTSRWTRLGIKQLDYIISWGELSLPSQQH